MFLLLFCPTATVGERWGLLASCKRKVLPPRLLEAYPALAELISLMMSNQSAARPTITDVLASGIFSPIVPFPRPLHPVVSCALEDQLSIRKGKQDVWKSKYVKLANDKLLIYESKSNSKARACYTLPDCKVAADSAPTSGNRAGKKDATVLVVIEHEELETLSLKLFTRSPHVADWLGQLLRYRQS